jgi:hypothetical protein
MDNLSWIIIGTVYLTTCIWTAVEADERGHTGMMVFFFCLVCSPLIGAIMFTTYKIDVEEIEVEEEEDSVDEEEPVQVT